MTEPQRPDLEAVDAPDPADLSWALKHIDVMADGSQPSWLSGSEATALRARIRQLERERDGFRIEADCAMRDYDSLELAAGELKDGLEKIARGRPNRTFDPWAKEVVEAALEAALAAGGSA